MWRTRALPRSSLPFPPGNRKKCAWKPLGYNSNAYAILDSKQNITVLLDCRTRALRHGKTRDLSINIERLASSPAELKRKQAFVFNGPANRPCPDRLRRAAMILVGFAGLGLAVYRPIRRRAATGSGSTTGQPSAEVRSAGALR